MVVALTGYPLRRATRVVWLTASARTLAGRIEGSGRPSLTGRPLGEEIGDVLARREPTFAALAELVVATDRGTPEAAADRILERL